MERVKNEFLVIFGMEKKANKMSDTHTPLQNHLLAALPAEVQQCLFPYLKLERFPLGKVLYEPGHTLSNVYFPIDSIVTLQYMTESGASAEIAMVGYEGVVGIAVFMGGASTISQALIQSAGHAYSLSAPLLLREFNHNSEMRRLLLRYTQSLITSMAQTAACNRHHSIDQQFCRWLLLSLDRLPGNTLTMSQELIANMLGVRREGVSMAAGKLKKLGLIKYCHGHITVLDRPRLEQLSCECYPVVKGETDHPDA